MTPLGRDQTDDMRRIGDEMQSESSRLASYVSERLRNGDAVPYEVTMAAIGIQRLVDQWTSLRVEEARA